MPVIDEHTVRQLAAVRSTAAPITTCYLDVDGRRLRSHQDYEQELSRLVRQTRQRMNGEASPSVERDLQRIEQHVKGGFDRSKVRGVAMFSCSAEDWWQEVPLPVPVRNQLVVNRSPYVRQLEWIVQRFERFGVLLADRQRARMFVFEMGELVDKSELFEQLPRHEDDGGEWDKDHVADHADAAAAAHIRHAAEVAFHVFGEHGFEHLIVGAPDETTGRLRAALHPYLSERLVAEISVPIGAGEAEIAAAALAVEEEVELAKEAALVDRLRNASGSGNGGVAGLEGSLAAVSDHRVDTLVVSRGFVAEGWRCDGCGQLAARGPSCPRCNGEMERVEDVVEEAIEAALVQAAQVAICDANADLDVLGRIGALLRY